MARPWKHKTAYLKLRDEDYHFLEAAAKTTLGRLPRRVRNQVAVEDLIDWGWTTVFRYCRTYEQWKTYGFLNCVRAMAQYAGYLYAQSRRVLAGPVGAALLPEGCQIMRDDEGVGLEAEVSHDWDTIDARLDASVLLAGVPVLRHREILGNYYLQGWSDTQIAKRHRCTHQSIQKIRMRAIEKLRRQTPRAAPMTRGQPNT